MLLDLLLESLFLAEELLKVATVKVVSHLLQEIILKLSSHNRAILSVKLETIRDLKQSNVGR